jgi:hypothetical protein
LFEKLENRQMMAVSPVVAGTKISVGNLASGGFATGQSLIVVPFSGNVAIADKSKIQLRGYAINPLSGGQKKVVINVVSASVSADKKSLQITTDRMMRKGGAINILSGALKDAKGDLLADQLLKSPKGQNKERFTLALRGFKPTDYSKFTPDLYAQSATPTDAGNAVDEATVQTALGAFLQKKVDKKFITATQRTAALARFTNATVKSIVPDANMRAAILSLTGTLAEPAVASYLDGKNVSGKPYTIIDFQDPPDPSAVVAQSIVSSTGRIRTLVKPAFRGEAFQVISAFLAHEALHQDGTISLQEETIATTMETMVYAQQALADSTFLSNKTTLVNTENDRLYAFIESGKAIFPYVGLQNAPIKNPAGGIFLGAKAQTGGVYTSYINYVNRQYQARGSQSKPSTPGNQLLKDYYTAIKGTAAPATLSFNDSLITDIDQFQQIVGTKQAIALAGALKLTLA